MLQARWICQGVRCSLTSLWLSRAAAATTRMLKAVVVVLASSFLLAQGMEPLAGPLVTQTVMQAGGDRL